MNPITALQKTEYLENKTTERFSVLSALVKENILTLEVMYVGCGNDEPYLLWDGNLMKSLPPKASLVSGYITEKKCEKNISRTLSFDIQPLRENTRKTGLVLLIEGFEKPIQIPAEKE